MTNRLKNHKWFIVNSETIHKSDGKQEARPRETVYRRRRILILCKDALTINGLKFWLPHDEKTGICSHLTINKSYLDGPIGLKITGRFFFGRLCPTMTMRMSYHYICLDFKNEKNLRLQRRPVRL